VKAQLRDWQKEALVAWQNAGKKATIKAATGMGKSILGIAAVEHVGVGAVGPQGILIAVPTIFLQKQWLKEIVKQGVATKKQIGLVGGGNNDLTKPITIGVVNSLRDIVLQKRLLILDEVHRYGSFHNFRFIDSGSFDYVMGFSATPEREDDEHKKLLEIAPMVYDISQRDGVERKHLCPFELINVGLQFTGKEASAYLDCDGMVRDGMRMYGGFNGVRSACRYGDKNAANVLRAISRRRQLILKSERKVKAAPIIVSNESNGHVPKTLVFCEYIEMAEMVKEEMEKFGFPSAVYHSNMNATKREEMLDGFKSGKFKVMVTAKCLDEGVDVPDCELGIILGGTKVKRQMIQRLGRILRNRPGKKARMYQLYMEGTKDIEWLNKRSTELANAADKVFWRRM